MKIFIIFAKIKKIKKESAALALKLILKMRNHSVKIICAFINKYLFEKNCCFII